MNLLTLYYFVELARELHVTNTAQKLYISQQNLSQHIQRLEQYYRSPVPPEAKSWPLPMRASSFTPWR